ncbi:hypothetical protein [Actinoplanes utahensis]|uniref:hypothetical protein n=1 Tax=Actinoplanes utahensis TaxID=1869 RepID=UPI00191C2780|nr:hypothetical protein [Actinoplanes utahensis]GIF34391.1 hypothetical protein Aut01nite_73770 [Actinoplanes utahensis]
MTRPGPAPGPLAASAASGPGAPVAGSLAASAPHGSKPFSGTGKSAPDAAGMNWPADETPENRPDWREKFALGADLALIGIVVTVAALPALTLPAALAAGSTAVRHRYVTGKLPSFRPLLRQYGRSLLPGLPAVLIGLLLLVDLIAVSRGWVPGGTPVLVLTAVVVTWLAGAATLTLVAVGREPGIRWRAALRWAGDQAITRPWTALAPALAGVLAFFLALSMPATIPLVIGFHLFAAHVISDRLAPAAPPTAPAATRGGHHPGA